MTWKFIRQFLKDQRGTASIEIIALSGALAVATATIMTTNGGAFGDQTQVDEEVYVRSCGNRVKVEGGSRFTTVGQRSCK